MCFVSFSPHADEGPQLTDKLPSPSLPYGCYDVGDGYFDPKTNAVYAYNGSVKRKATAEEASWAMAKCRVGTQKETLPQSAPAQAQTQTQPERKRAAPAASETGAPQTQAAAQSEPQAQTGAQASDVVPVLPDGQRAFVIRVANESSAVLTVTSATIKKGEWQGAAPEILASYARGRTVTFTHRADAGVELTGVIQMTAQDKAIKVRWTWSGAGTLRTGAASLANTAPALPITLQSEVQNANDTVTVLRCTLKDDAGEA